MREDCLGGGKKEGDGVELRFMVDRERQGQYRAQ